MGDGPTRQPARAEGRPRWSRARVFSVDHAPSLRKAGRRRSCGKDRISASYRNSHAETRQLNSRNWGDFGETAARLWQGASVSADVADVAEAVLTKLPGEWTQRLLPKRALNVGNVGTLQGFLNGNAIRLRERGGPAPRRKMAPIRLEPDQPPLAELAGKAELGIDGPTKLRDRGSRTRSQPHQVHLKDSRQIALRNLRNEDSEPMPPSANPDRFSKASATSHRCGLGLLLHIETRESSPFLENGRFCVSG